MVRLCIYFLFIIFYQYSNGIGLATTFGEIKLTDLKIGCTYLIESFRVTNTSSKPVTIKINVASPDIAQLKSGYEPIPDTSWIKLEKDKFENVLPGHSIDTDIFVVIPQSTSLLGKKYQAYLYSYIEPVPLMAVVTVGLNTRLLLEINSELPKVEKKQRINILKIIEKLIPFKRK